MLAVGARVTTAALLKGQTIGRCAQQSLAELSARSGCASWRSTARSHSAQGQTRSLESPQDHGCASMVTSTALLNTKPGASLPTGPQTSCARTISSSTERSSLPTKPSRVSLGEIRAACQEMGPSTGSSSAAGLHLLGLREIRVPGRLKEPSTRQHLSLPRRGCLVHHKSG